MLPVRKLSEITSGTSTMDKNEQEFLVRLTAIAKTVPNFLLTKEVVATYDRLLSPLGYENVNRALDEILIERDSRDPFPSIKDIRAKVNPALDPTAEAVRLANMIAGGVSKHGPYNIERAKAEIGPLGWEAVKAYGGWEIVCEALTNSNRTTMIPQFREHILAILKGQHVSRATQIESHSSGNQLLSFNEVMQKAKEFNVSETKTEGGPKTFSPGEKK